MKKVFFINSETISVYQWHNNEILDAIQFPLTELGKHDFASSLQVISADPAIIVVDLIDEEYVQESIPHVSAHDRKALIARKLEPHFRKNKYKLSILQNRDSRGRHDDHLLFSSFSSSQTVSWLPELLLQHKIPLAGIYSAPVLCGEIFRKTGINTKANLLLSCHASSNMRQSFYLGHHLKTSRISQVNMNESLLNTSNLEYEIDTNKRYLQRIQLLRNINELDTYIVTGQALDDSNNKTLEGFVASLDKKPVHYLQINAIASKLGLRNRLNANQFDLLVAHLACTVRRVPDYASDNEKRYFYTHTGRRALIAASIAISTLTVISGLYMKFSASDYHARKNIAYQQLAALQLQHKSLKNELPRFPMKARDVKSLTNLYKKLDLHRPEPLRIYQHIGKHLKDFPMVRLDSINWSNRQANSSDKLVILVKGHIEPFDGDYIKVHNSLGKLKNSIEKDSYFRRVIAVTMPINVSSETDVQGGNEDRFTASFEFRLITGWPK